MTTTHQEGRSSRFMGKECASGDFYGGERRALAGKPGTGPGPGPRLVRCAASVAAALGRMAQAAHPGEAWAALGGRRDGEICTVFQLLPLPALRMAPAGWSADPFAFARADAALRRAGLGWLGFGHSHPDGSATPSRLDRVRLWRHCLHFILPVVWPGLPGPLSAWWLEADGTPRALPLEPAS